MTRPHLMRSCVVCRERAEKAGLMRFVFADRLIWDREQRLPGRGAYVHPAAKCVAGMLEKRRWERAFRADAAALGRETLAEAQREVRRVCGWKEPERAANGRGSLTGPGKVRL